MHHTHYILLDDGTKRNYIGIEDRLSALMDAISKGRSEQAMQGTNIPVESVIIEVLQNYLVPAVTLVVEGGLDTIKSMFHSLCFGIPVVLINVNHFCRIN